MKKILVLALLTIFSLYQAIAEVPTEENHFSNAIVGLSVMKPGGWNFISADENIENLKRTELNDKEFQELMVRHSTAPLVAMMKYPEPFDDLNPSFKINIKPLGGFTADKPVEIINLILPQFERVLKDYELISKPVEIEISGHKAAYAKIHYSLQIPDGREFPTCSEMWIVPRGHFFFMIGAGTRQDEKTGKRSEIQSILNTLKIEHLEK